MMKNLLLSATFMIYSISSIAQIGKLVDKAKAATSPNSSGLSTTDISSALKQALEQGASKSVETLSKPDGFFMNPSLKIVFPPEALKAEATLRKLGFHQTCDDAILSFNRAAEDAALKAKPIFMAAIRQLSIADAKNILGGNVDAATNYLKNHTTDSLTQAFKPIVDQSLAKVNATRYYGDFVQRYNKVPMVSKLNPDISSYITQKAIEGIFKEIAQEELKIRQNPTLRSSELMQKVFSSIKK